MPANPHYWIMKREDMHFVYAAFFTDRDDVYIKVGESVRPYKRIVSVAQGAPFVLDRAVFAHAGSQKVANRIEQCMKLRLEGYRTRGEWFRFPLDQGKVFSATIKAVFASSTGRKLEWTDVNMDELRRDASLGFDIQHSIASEAA